VYSDKKDDLRVAFSMIARTNKLSKVSNPLGGSISIDYAHSQGTDKFPGGKWVMSGVTIEDGRNEDRLNGAAAKFDAKQIISYENGKYERYEREFLGFQNVTTTNLHFDGRVERHNVVVIDNSNYYVAGNIQEERIEDTSKPRKIFSVRNYE